MLRNKQMLAQGQEERNAIGPRAKDNHATGMYRDGVHVIYEALEFANLVPSLLPHYISVMRTVQLVPCSAVGHTDATDIMTRAPQREEHHIQVHELTKLFRDDLKSRTSHAP